jgi:hypothetical protein
MNYTNICTFLPAAYLYLIIFSNDRMAPELSLLFLAKKDDVDFIDTVF